MASTDRARRCRPFLLNGHASFSTTCRCTHPSLGVQTIVLNQATMGGNTRPVQNRLQGSWNFSFM